MPIEDFIIHVFCDVEQSYQEVVGGIRLRGRGFEPKLSDSEVITMEIVGEFLGIDTDKGIWKYFRTHWKGWFPQLGSRANFVKHSANLWAVKQRILQRLSMSLGGFSDPIHIVDGFPMPVCLFARAPRSQCFEDSATFGYCATKKETYYGFQGVVMINFEGVITGFTVVPANVDEREALWDVVNSIYGLLIGDKGYLRPILKQELLEQQGIDLQTPVRRNMPDTRPKAFVKSLMSARRLVETVIGQLAGQFHIEKVRARDLWHLTNRFVRKLLSHTMGVFLNRSLGREPLQFEGLITA